MSDCVRRDRLPVGKLRKPCCNSVLPCSTGRADTTTGHLRCQPSESGSSRQSLCFDRKRKCFADDRAIRAVGALWRVQGFLLIHVRRPLLRIHTTEAFERGYSSS